MNTAAQLQADAIICLNSIYNQSFTQNDFQINITKPEFEGDYTIVMFALLKKTGQNPNDIGNALGQKLMADFPTKYIGFNIIKGFLNINFSDGYWLQFLQTQYSNINFGKQPSNGKKVMVEYSSPNTNKPLHLGHLRNNFLGWSVAEILKASGNEVVKTCIVNDRGVHICKSMIAWQKFGNGATPSSTNTKGDHFVGEYYVKFNDAYKAEVEALVASGTDAKVAEKEAPIMRQTQQMLLDWEAGKPEVMELWRTMNAWVYEGFNKTYTDIGSDFDKTYYESNTYLLGKKTVELGLQKGVFEQDADNSVWIDLTADGLDRKIVQRKDGTSVYITQDIGLAQQKYDEYGIDKSIYVIGDEQNYHMKVLKLIAEKLELPNAQNIFHLSYGMVELPSGKMKSREGTVVDADDLVAEMIATAQKHTENLGKVDGFTTEELTALYNNIGLGAMKFYLLRVDPKKKMIFNPEESIDFHGFTAPFVQYTYARTRNILRKLPLQTNIEIDKNLSKAEKAIVVLAEQFPSTIEEAAQELDPSKIANYVFNLAKTFNSFLAEHSVLHAENEAKQQLRLQLATLTTNIIKKGMQLLGIQVPEKM
jgi:arginyl-tRNA synthetase